MWLFVWIDHPKWPPPEGVQKLSLGIPLQIYMYSDDIYKRGNPRQS